MAKVIYGNLQAGRSVKSATRAVGKKRVASAGGRKTIRTLDANDANFDDDLVYVFSKNVAKARRENKTITGSHDIAPRKR